MTYLSRYVKLTSNEEEQVSKTLIYKSYKKGEFIGRQGEVCREQTFILNGGVRTYYLDDSGKEHVVAFAIENWWAGDLGSFLSQKPADYDVQCFADTEVNQITYDGLQSLYDRVPKMERFYRMLVQNAYVATQRRVVDSHALSAGERYAKFCQQYPQIEQRVPQYMVASYLGMSKEFLSKLRSKTS